MKLLSITVNFVKHLLEKKYLIYELTKRDFQGKYVSSYLGLAWAILEPLSFMLILWLIFGIGLRGGRNMSIPYHVYLISGLCVYLFFIQTLGQAMAGIKSSSFLINKVDFRFEILPLVKILSGLMFHFIVLGIVVIISVFQGLMPNAYWLQVPYYTFSLFALLLGISWLTSAVVLFVPDITNVVTIILRFLFYLSPIFWEIGMFPEKFHIVLKLNPIYYVIVGYRNSLYHRIPFWDDLALGAYFWSLTFFFLLAGMIVFKKLRPHFADVV